MQISPKIITGALHAQNKGAFDWGWQGLLAYGCQQYVVVIDPDTSQNVQTLWEHKENVTVVKWRREAYHHDVANPYKLCLASGDTSGVVVIWNVTQGVMKFRFQHGNKSVIDMSWLYEIGKQDMLLALYSGSCVVLWDCLTGSQLWNIVFPESLVSITLDPFNSHNAMFLGDDCALLIADLDTEKPPSKSAYKIGTSLQRDTGTGSSPATPVTPTSPITLDSSGVRRNPSSWNKLVSFTSNSIQNILTGEIKLRDSKQRKSISELEDTINCIQVTYHPGVKHNLLLVYPYQILIFDVDIHIIICTIQLGRAASPFVKVIPCQNKDILFCLHENGSISLRCRRVDGSFCPPNHKDSGTDMVYDLMYDPVCQSDAVRMTNTSRLVGFTYNPVTEKTLCLILGDGRVLFWDVILGPGERKLVNKCHQAHMSKSEMSISTISDLIGPSVTNLKHKPNVRFLLTGVVYGLVSPITVIKTCPPVHNNKQHNISSKDNVTPIVAVGSDSGMIQIVDLDSGQIVQEFDVFFNSNVGGIEWLSPNDIITWSSPSVYSATVPGQVRNVIYQLSLKSGQTSPIRVKKDPESMITSIKVSPHRKHFLIAFEKQALEIWSLKTRRLLRELPPFLPLPVEMVWSPTVSWITVQRKFDIKTPKLETTAELKTTASLQMTSETEIRDIGLKLVSEETMIYTDKDGGFLRLILEESIITDMTVFPPAASKLSMITQIAWKGSNVVMGDLYGYIRVFSLKIKESRYLNDKVFPGLKKIVISPSMSENTFLVFYENSVDTWCITSDKLEIVSSLKCPQDIDKITDVEWASGNQLLLLTQNGCLHVFDKSLSYSRSLLKGRKLEDPIFCPHMLPLRGSFLLKHSLQHCQDITFTNKNDRELELAVKEQSQIVDRNTLNRLNSDSVPAAERFLYVARLFGDEFEIQFWTLCHHFLNKAPISDSNELISFDAETDLVKEFNKNKLCDCDCCLEKKFDVLQPDRCFKCQQLYRVGLHERKRLTYEDGQKCVENYILLDQMDAAVRILLETDFEKDGYKTDYLRACLLACERSTPNAQSILKLVATHLIIGSKLTEGVELMCLMGKTLDACKYLQSYGQWEKAAWLAKAILVTAECQDVFNKWIDHLIQNKNYDQAVLIMVSQGQFLKAIKFLNDIGYIDMAFNLMTCYQKDGKYTDSENDTLFQEVKEKYLKYLDRLGCSTADT